MNLTSRIKDTVLDCLLGEAEKMKRDLEFEILKECYEFTIHMKEFIDKKMKEKES